ncbi:PAAR domain-containing protein [Fluviispira vulneris]|uniref:PAAR domain-containing protein n=1 Tax=Fluviispira vulneris TaxID=2763012 RepID=UPI001649106C|nr:PAAR domain-containing protein [Fluviispira vulneris]
MQKGIVVEGDPLSNGGVVVKGTGTYVDGFKIALEGDLIHCASHGFGAISEGDSNIKIDGRGIALEGHKTSCGCSLIAEQIGEKNKIDVPEPSFFENLKSVLYKIEEEIEEFIVETINNIHEFVDDPIEYVCKDYDKPENSRLKRSPLIIAKGLACSFRDNYVVNQNQNSLQKQQDQINKIKKSDVETKLDCSNNKYRGGVHEKTRLPIGDGKDSHHIPAKSAYKGSKMNPDGRAMKGPAIQMDPEDHIDTMSHGSKGLESIQYIDKQKDFIQQGRLKEAVQMDIDDVYRIAVKKGDPNKYKCAIQEMEEYLKTLNPSDFK